MLRYLVRQKAAIAAVAGVALIVSVGGAYATSADGNKVMHGCVRLKTGDLRVETQGSPCVTDGPWSQRERAESWNQQGVVGADGADGAAGPAGADGTDGAIGPMGPVGAAGDRGPAGSAGAIGPVGPAGAIGPAGPTGAIGPAGPAGAIGPAGPSGAIGTAGSAGAIGPVGPAGAIGPVGPTGPTGSTGAPGAAGTTGATGATGATGPAGSGALKLKDGNGTLIGQAVSIDRYEITVITSTGYLLSLLWDGSQYENEVLYTGDSCSGTAYLLGSAGAAPISAKTVVYSPGLVAVPDTTGSSAAPSVAVSPASTRYQGCAASSAPSFGYKLKPTTAVALGLPTTFEDAGQLTGPLSLS